MERDNLSYYEPASHAHSVGIIGVPTDLGSDSPGLSQAPRSILDTGLEKVITSLGSEVVGIEMLSVPAGAASDGGHTKNLEEIARVARTTADLAEGAARRGETIIGLGGDHSMAIGTISGAARAHRSLGVVWIDAHPDCNTPETTMTGNIHGQVTSALMGFGHPMLTAIGRNIASDDFLYIGLKDIDQAEIEFLRGTKARCITMLDIASRGLSRAMLAIDALQRRVDSVWVSMDMDSIDSADAPGVGLQNHGGLSRREVLSLAHYIGKTCRVAGFDIVEVSPDKDEKAKTARLALELTARFLGGEYSWYQNEYMDSYSKENIVRTRR